MTRRELLLASAVLLPLGSRRTIFVELAGGPSHVDTFAFEPGPWTPRWMQPIRCREGFFPAGLMPRLARKLDRIKLVRGLRAKSLDHHSVVREGRGPMLRATAASFPQVCAEALAMREPFVHIRFASWDHHGNLYEQLRPMAQSLDEGAAKLIDAGVRVVAMGEFGRRPGPLNQNGGRDHFPVHAALLA